MSVKYGVTLLLLAAACTFSALSLWGAVGWFALPFLYAAFSFLLLGIGYLGVGPRVFLKRADGRLHPLSFLLFGPYFLLNGFAFWLYRSGNPEAAHVEVLPNLYFGRRLTDKEARAARLLSWRAVLDLAVEFTEVRELREIGRYCSLPVLDATAPTAEQLQTAVRWIAESLPLGPVYVHCALGHGRSATAIAAYLLAQGEVGTVQEVVARLRALRPGIKLHPRQVARLRPFERG